MKVDDSFISIFFDRSNNEMNIEKQPNDRRVLLEKLRSSAILDSHIPVILPRRWKGETIWYVMARSPQQERILREQLRAFFSEPISNFDGTRGEFDANDSIDRLVTSKFGKSVFKIKSTSKNHFNDSIKLLFELLQSQPSRSLELARPLARVFRDFEWSLQIGDSDSSSAYMKELIQHGRFSQENVWYLEIRRQAAMGEWNAIIKHRHIEDLLNLRRPLNITYLLLRALQNTILSDPSQSEESLRECLSRGSLAGFQGIKLMDDGSLPIEVHEPYRKIQALFVSKLSKVVDDYGIPRGGEVKTRQIDQQLDLNQAEQLIKNGDYLGALKNLELQPQSGRRALLYLRLTHASPTPDMFDRSYREIEALPSSMMKAIEGRAEVRELIEWVNSKVVDKHVPKSLMDWVNLFDKKLSSQQLEELFETHHSTWNIEKLDAPSIRILADKIEEHHDHDVLQRCLPNIYGIVRTARLPDRIVLLNACFTVLVIERVPTSADQEAMHQIVDELLENIGDSASRKTIFDEVLNIWKDISSARRVGWALDLIQIAKETSPAADIDTSIFISEMAGVIGLLPHRSVNAAVRFLAHQILDGVYEVEKLLGHIFQDKNDKDGIEIKLYSQLNGLRIGLYCLETKRSSKISGALLALTENSQVVVNSDHVCTGSLRSLSKNSDFMIILTSAAKHSATQCIDDNRDGPTLRVHSTGLSTVITAVARYLEQNSLQDA